VRREGWKRKKWRSRIREGVENTIFSKFGRGWNGDRDPGVRATIYEIADQHNALQYTNEPVFARSKKAQF
jgi:hypothetical protein